MLSQIVQSNRLESRKQYATAQVSKFSWLCENYLLHLAVCWLPVKFLQEEYDKAVELLKEFETKSEKLSDKLEKIQEMHEKMWSWLEENRRDWIRGRGAYAYVELTEDDEVCAKFLRFRIHFWGVFVTLQLRFRGLELQGV